MNEGFDLLATHGNCKTDGSCLSNHRQSNSSAQSRVTELASGAMECLPMSAAVHHTHLMATSGAVGAATPAATVVVGATYPHHLHHHHHLSHHAGYSNSYGSHAPHPIHSEQTKSLQELQHEVGALLEFRDLVIETFPDLKHKMASISATPSTPNSVGGHSVGSHSVGAGGSSSLAARREWEPGIRIKRKSTHKEPSTTSAVAAGAAAEPASTSLTRSRSNSHSGKKEPKSGENNNGSVVQDSGFSTETSSSKEGHSASSTNGAMTAAIASNRLSCAESDDELLNLLDVIHRKSNRLREEVEQLQSYERQQSSEDAKSSQQQKLQGMTSEQFRAQVDRLNREDLQQLRKERDRLLDKLAEMEAETLTGRIKAAKMNDQVEQLIGVKKDLEEQLKLAMAQKLELSARVQQMQLQPSKSSFSASSQSEQSSQRNFLSSATTVRSLTTNTFQPVVVCEQPTPADAFHQSSGSDTRQQQQQQQPAATLGRLDGIVSTPGARSAKCRVTDSKRFTAILLETNVLELQRHLLTLTVQNQVLAQKLDSSSKSKAQLSRRLDKSVEDTEELRFQLEEKNIELEGTKAQLRVLESRLHASSATNSYLNSSSQHDYETNRSTASTTLMLSRRGVPDSVDSTSAPRSNQISTPSMKAMVPLAMEELQQHSSSTESAHEHEPQNKTIVNVAASSTPLGSSTPTPMPMPNNKNASNIAARVMSSSVGGVSSFDQLVTPPPRGHAFRKFSSAGKPSKIPLPGSKAAAYFAGKPPTGRTAAGRSPSSVDNSSNVSYGSSNKSSLSRSTGNLSQRLKHADSNSIQSLSTNTSRSSTSSSIPLATTPYSSNRSSSHTTTTTPSPRVLQNSPLPKLKRETLSSRVRHLDSLSRSQDQQQQQISSSSIAAQLSTTLRKDLQLSSGASAGSSSSTSYHRRGAGSGAVARRFSSASSAGDRQQRYGQSNDPTATPTSSYGDSDSGKNLTKIAYPSNFRCNRNHWQLWQTSSSNYNYNNNNKQGYAQELLSEADVSAETAYDSYYTQYITSDAVDCGGDNLLVTFDYGYSDSVEALPLHSLDEENECNIWFGTPPPNDAAPFQVHHVQHKLPDYSLQSLISYDVDADADASQPATYQDVDQDEEVFYDSIEG
ncbi:probable GPI-anchored adhesin-like protein PGA55 isoform X2 [Drosophila busckii]|uniref:probable GPI-anchored adhesin-like protein PGA55 isoform X2 n=1 Tax=Drosophila busckii TaxID=30019 RepID=UPI00083EC8AB|nr:probable GPI-anchored adhesin-like protein PGA55 isoform X2 [Drosophila busckii]